MTARVRIDDEVHASLKEIACREERSMGHVIAEAIRHYRREKFWNLVQEDFARLQADEVARRAYLAETELLEGGLRDGLADAPPYFTPEEEAAIRAEAAESNRRFASLGDLD